MSQIEFVLSLSILVLIFIMRNKIAEQLNDSLELSFKLQGKWIAYIIALVFVIIITIAMIFGPKQSFGVSGGLENMSTSTDKKPHRFFDINFDIFKF